MICLRTWYIGFDDGVKITSWGDWFLKDAVCYWVAWDFDEVARYV
jgi:hypothetical protein